VTLGSILHLRDSLWFSDYLLTVLKSTARPSSPQQSEVCDTCIFILTSGASVDGKPGPAAPSNCGETVLNELKLRREMAEKARELNIARLDECVGWLYAEEKRSNTGPTATWAECEAKLSELEPHITSEESTVALGKLGVTMEAGWDPLRATPVCIEVRRTALEASLKLKLRLWFSNREQSVWRTLQGLAKAHDALSLLHNAACDAIRSAGTLRKDKALPPLPSEVFTVVAALQVYGKWVSDRSKMLK
jgi:hypothetical protein